MLNNLRSKIILKLLIFLGSLKIEKTDGRIFFLISIAPLVADFEITTCYLHGIYFGLNAFLKTTSFWKMKLFFIKKKTSLLSIVKPTDWHNEINSETKMTWNLSTTSPAAYKHFSLNK